MSRGGLWQQGKWLWGHMIRYSGSERLAGVFNGNDIESMADIEKCGDYGNDCSRVFQ